MSNIKLDRIKNVRDLGGIEIKDGKIKERRLLRGTCLYNLTQADINILVNEYKLSTIIDLRTKKEKSKKPEMELKGVKYIHMPIFDKTVPGVSHENSEKLVRGKVLDLTNFYRGILKGEYLENIEKIIKTIMNLDEKEYSVLFHCTEGKDRTGIIAAVILMILGADKQTIIDDYLYTNLVNEKKANSYYWKTLFLKFDKSQAETMKNYFLAKQEYIESVFDVIEKDWNGLENFIENGLKISREEIEIFREKMITKEKKIINEKI